jgi:hypothetical protein
MTFSLGLRACLVMRTDPLSPDLRPAIEVLDELWVDDGDEWRGGVGERTSVHGTHAVVLAYESLRKAQRLIDPLTLFDLVRLGAEAKASNERALQLKLGPDASVVVQDAETGVSIGPIDLGSNSWRLVARVAELGSGTDPMIVVPFDALGDLSKNPRAMIRRINERVNEATNGRLPRLIRVPRAGTGCSLSVQVAERSLEP